MPWHLVRREGKVCVIKDSDGSTAGCHGSRSDAVKQMRALYANESRMASMYAELDAITPEEYEEVAAMPEASKSELVKIEVGGGQSDALTASVLQALGITNKRLEESEQLTLNLVAALQSISERESVVNVTTPEVKVDVPPAQVTVQPADVRVEAPNVTVYPEITVPAQTKTITFERDFDGRVTKADVREQ